jgi:hypothetical protein
MGNGGGCGPGRRAEERSRRCGDMHRETYSLNGIRGRRYDAFVPRADDLYDEHLKILEEEGLI